MSILSFVKMSFLTNLRNSKEFADVLKNTPRTFQEILEKLSSGNISSENDLLSIKKDLLFSLLVGIAIENGIQPVLKDCEVCDPGAIDVQCLSKWKLLSGLYEAEFVMLGQNEISIKLLLIPLNHTALVNAVINKMTLETYSVCLSINEYFVFTKYEMDISKMFCNLQQLSDKFKNHVLTPVKSKILGMCGYPGPSLLELPEDLFFKIMLYLPLSDILSVTLVSKKCNQYLNEHDFWHKLYLRDLNSVTIVPQLNISAHMHWKLSYQKCYTLDLKCKEHKKRQLYPLHLRNNLGSQLLVLDNAFDLFINDKDLHDIFLYEL